MFSDSADRQTRRASMASRLRVCLMLLRSAVRAALLTAAGAATAATMIDLPGAHVFPEGMTSTSDGTLFVGSVADGGVLRVRKGGKIVDQWVKPGEHDTASIFGLMADERSRTLWICSSDVSELGVRNPGKGKGSALIGVDLKTRQLKTRAEIVGKDTLCNDIAVGPDGSAYVTNSPAGEILRLRPGSSTFERWAADAQFLGPPFPYIDGLAFGSDGHLYVNAYEVDAFYRVVVENGVAARISKLATSRALVTADGMRPLGGNRFVMVEAHGRLSQLTVSGDTVAVETLKEGLSGPTAVTVVGNIAWVAEGQLDALLDPAKRHLLRLPFRLYAVPLGRR